MRTATITLTRQELQGLILTLGVALKRATHPTAIQNTKDLQEKLEQAWMDMMAAPPPLRKRA